MRAADPLGGANSAALLVPSYMATQVDIMQSDRVAVRVVRTLRLAEAASMRDEWQDDTGGRGNYETWLAKLLQRRLEVRPSRESNVIEVQFSSVDPRFSVAVANGFAQAYLETAVDLRVDPARRYSAFFDERGKKLREEVEAAQARLLEFQKRKGILATEERLDIETSRMNELSSQLVQMQATSADSRSREVAAGIAPESMQEVIANPVIEALRSDAVRQETRLRELNQRLGDEHPSVTELRSHITELRARTAQEVQRLSAGVGVSSILLASREAQLQASLDAQRARVLALKGARDELAVLQRDVDLAQRTYDAVSSRLAQMTLEGASSQTNATLLVAATEPARASFPVWPLNLTLGASVGLLLGMGAALARSGRPPCALDRRRGAGPEAARAGHAAAAGPQRRGVGATAAARVGACR